MQQGQFGNAPASSCRYPCRCALKLTLIDVQSSPFDIGEGTGATGHYQISPWLPSSLSVWPIVRSLMDHQHQTSLPSCPKCIGASPTSCEKLHSPLHETYSLRSIFQLASSLTRMIYIQLSNLTCKLLPHPSNTSFLSGHPCSCLSKPIPIHTCEGKTSFKLLQQSHQTITMTTFKHTCYGTPTRPKKFTYLH